METTIHTDTQALFHGDDGEMLAGIATYEITDDLVLDYRAVELVTLKIGELILSRYQVADAIGEAKMAKIEAYIAETEHLPDPAGDAADRDFDREVTW